MRIRDIIFSWDLWVAIAIAILEWLILPANLLNKTAVAFYYITCTVSAILFAVYFAGFVVIVSAPADEFLQFAEKRKLFTQLLGFFKFTLWLLAFGLIGSIIGYCASSFLADRASVNTYQPVYWVVAYSFVFWYGLFAAAVSIHTTMTFAQYRNKYLAYKKQVHQP